MSFMSEGTAAAWVAAVIIVVFGFVGGTVAALAPLFGSKEPGAASAQSAMTRGKALATVFVGGVAALLSWALQQPVVNYPIYGGGSAQGTPSVTYGAAATAVLVGFVGTRWLRDRAEKTLASERAALASERAARAEGEATALRSAQNA